MSSAREQGGGLDEAARLLQEGLQLLDERTREVDALVQDAETRAQALTEEAERRAQEITAEAERQRLELEREVATLRAEVATLREEIARAPRGSRRQAAASSAAVASTATPAPPADAALTPESDSPAAEATRPEEPGPPADAPVAPVATTEGPRWGRPSTVSAQQAIKTRSSRPRWLPRWLPFVLLLLPLVGQMLTIPRETGWLYRVQPEEDLEQLAERFGITVMELLEASRLQSAAVRAGELIFVPSKVTEPK